MTKISTASIRLVMKKNRSNSVGEHPIYIVICFNGRKEKSTGVFVNERYWNPAQEVIKKSCPNSTVLNKILNDMKQKIINKKNEFEFNGKQYTPSMLLEDGVQDFSANKNEYRVIYKQYLSEMASSSSTVKLYDYNFNILKKFIGKDDFLINDVSLPLIKKLIKSLDLGDNSIRGICGRIASVWNFAIRKGLVDSSDYPFKDFVYSQKYKKVNRVYYLDKINLIKVRDWFFNRCLNIDGNLFGYKEGIDVKLEKKNTIEFTCMCFLACFICNGSAPIDLALLKADNCSRVTINGIDYWKIQFKRKKTNMPVVCLLKRDMLTMVCFERFLGTAFMRDNYIYPILKKGMSDKQITNAIGKFTYQASKHLKAICKEINEQTIKNNVDNGLNEPLIDTDKMSLYVARHTKANDYLSHPGATLHALATLMGRSVNGLDTYVHMIRNDSDLAAAESLSSI